MKRYFAIISVIVLIASLILLFDKLFTPQPIQIVLQSGQEITTQTADYFSLSEAILLIVCAFLIGTTATYLFYNADGVRIPRLHKKEGKSYDSILPLLKDDEKRVVIALRDANGEMLQNKLVVKLNLSKVKITRVISSLQSKNLIVKERNGLTNNIRLMQ